LYGEALVSVNPKNAVARKRNADMIAQIMQALATLWRRTLLVITRGPELAKQWRVIRSEFDGEYYLACNPDVVGMDPLVHFLFQGWREDRDPSPNFSIADYTLANPAVTAAGANPFYHYLTIGRRDGMPLEASVP